ncbi:hypothetical protein F511_12943 [Dorcoceras hygrometricum]|uniref:Uncharacterized protein n=1 Tax=Dorcoceras hygrometricum TaxID=472368 RepID=A0A2Z7CI65_9LAMI|nr:hypothetical protein F511_12943 [Dorcoceras hygrometricum]
MTPSAPRTRAATTIRMKQIALDYQSRTIRRLKAQLASARRELDIITKENKANQIALEASHMIIAGLTKICLKAEDLMQAQHLIIEALVEEKDSLLQTIQGLQEANNSPDPFYDEWRKKRKYTRRKKRFR